MEEKPRKTMLALSGLLFVATACGWVLHNNQSPSQPQPQVEQPKVTAMLETPPSLTAPAAAKTASDTPAQSSALAPPGSAQQAEGRTASRIYPKTSMEQAIMDARASIGRDPMQPVNRSALASTSRTSAPLRGSRHSGRGSTFIPPPPSVSFSEPPVANYPTFDEANQPAPANYSQRQHQKVMAEDFRLVGLIDGKAIFKLSRNVAEELQLPRSFTLGPGESFANIKLDGVTVESATINDGNKLAVKSLEPVH